MAADISTTGQRLWEKSLAEQALERLLVFDGMIAAGDRLYYATTDGRIIAMGK